MIADIVAEDREGRPILLVELEARSAGEDAVRRLLDDLAASPESVAFGMLVDPEWIRTYRRGETSPVSEFDAIETLRHYSPGYGAELIREKHPRLLKIHLSTLVEVWLRDLAHHWKSGEPPRREEFGRIGLLPLLKDSSVDVEVRLIGHAVH
jgi:hypothetical protein